MQMLYKTKIQTYHVWSVANVKGESKKVGYPGIQ